MIQLVPGLLLLFCWLSISYTTVVIYLSCLAKTFWDATYPCKLLPHVCIYKVGLSNCLYLYVCLSKHFENLSETIIKEL